MHLPGPLRAVVGLAATAATEAKHLPDRAIELPMLVVSSALQASLRAQQRYARLAARGDDVLNRRTPTEEPPPWATFDEPVPLDELRRSVEGAGDGPLGRSSLERLFGVEDPTVDPDGREPVGEIPSPDEPPVNPVQAPAASVDGASAKRASKKAPKKAPATRSAAKSTGTKAAKKATARQAAAKAKTVSKPRHTAPSAFDNATDATDDADI